MDLHTGIPFWPLRDGLLASYPALKRDLAVEVAIVGAGITGALAGYELSRLGADVVILDGRDAASGSSAATSGLLLYDTDASFADLSRSVGQAAAARTYRLGLEAIDRIEELTRVLGDPCGFCRRPSLYLASRRRDVEGLRTEYEARLAHGFDVDWLSRRDLDTLGDVTAPAAIRSRGTAEVDAYRLTHRLLRAAASAGARVFDRTRVTEWEFGSGSVRLGLSTGRTVDARRVVCAPGYEAAATLQRPTGRLATTWLFVSEPLDDFAGWPDRCLIWETARPYVYLRTTEDGRVLAGGEDEPGPERHLSRRRFHRKIERLLRRTRKMFPRLEVEIAHAWAGTFATTGDGLPFIGSVPECPGVWFALGYGGNGITFSVVAATLIRDMYLGLPTPDASLFRLDRVAAPGRPSLSAANAGGPREQESLM
jgi:glycine/D-amino acid oxidase-like deaminating enzyme